MGRTRSSTVAGALVVFLLGTVAFAGGASAASEQCALGMVCLPSSDPTPTPTPRPTPAEPAPEPAPASKPKPAEPAPAASPQPKPDPDPTGSLLVLLNRERTTRGLPAFVRRPDVDGIAAGWSIRLADAGALSHNDAYFSADTRRRLNALALGENVARNGSIESAHAALMNSPGHRANILNAKFTVIGLGAESRNGSWWVTENFLQPGPAPSARPAMAAASASTTKPATARPVDHVTSPRPSAIAESSGSSARATPSAPLTLLPPDYFVATQRRSGLSTTAHAPRVPDNRPASTAAAVAGFSFLGVACLGLRRRIQGSFRPRR